MGRVMSSFGEASSPELRGRPCQGLHDAVTERHSCATSHLDDTTSTMPRERRMESDGHFQRLWSGFLGLEERGRQREERNCI